jgi:catechol 2,3-dioxygenase-like lactoylglutathione lyase family enzyme
VRRQAMSKVKLIHHVNIQITDRERTREWYERVLGCEFLDRGPALNQRQLQMRIGNGEMHFSTVAKRADQPASNHFAIEVTDWEGMLAHLDKEGVPYGRSDGSRGWAPTDIEDPRCYREDTGEHYTYIHDPDGNMIELVYHPLGWRDSKGDKVEIEYDPQGMGVVQKPGWVAQQYEEAKEKATA